MLPVFNSSGEDISAELVLTGKQRREFALAYFRQGMTLDDLKRSLNYENPGEAFADIQSALQDTPLLALSEAVALEAARLDRLQLAVWGNAVEGDEKAVGAVLKIMERRARLLGLDAAERRKPGEEPAGGWWLEKGQDKT